MEKQVAADAMTPESLKARHLLALGRRESKSVKAPLCPLLSLLATALEHPPYVIRE